MKDPLPLRNALAALLAALPRCEHGDEIPCGAVATHKRDPFFLEGVRLRFGPFRCNMHADRRDEPLEWAEAAERAAAELRSFDLPTGPNRVRVRDLKPGDRFCWEGGIFEVFATERIAGDFGVAFHVRARDGYEETLAADMEVERV